MDFVLFAPLLAVLPAFCMARLRRDGLGLAGGGMLIAGAALKGGELAYAAGLPALEAFYLVVAALGLVAAAVGAALFMYYRRTGKTPRGSGSCPVFRRCPAGGQ